MRSSQGSKPPVVDVSRGISYERDGKVAHIQFRRPDTLNSFDDDMVKALREAFWEFDDDAEAHIAILSGEGGAFSSGANVLARQGRSAEEMKRIGRPAARDAEGEGLLYNTVNWKPVIAAVHGVAVGMGLALALESDIVVATEDTRFQITEVPRGLWGSRHWALMHFRGAGAFADEVTLTGRFFYGREAASRGVINASCDEGEHVKAAMRYAEQMLEIPPLALRAATRARRWYMQKHEQEEVLLRGGFPLHLTEDFRQSVTAFLEKREPPPFQGR